jgi:hypothetical protein
VKFSINAYKTKAKFSPQDLIKSWDVTIPETFWEEKILISNHISVSTVSQIMKKHSSTFSSLATLPQTAGIIFVPKEMDVPQYWKVSLKLEIT